MPSPMLLCSCGARLVLRHPGCICWGGCECGKTICHRCPTEEPEQADEPTRITIGAADPALAEHLDAAIWQPSMLPGQPAELLGDQKPLFEGGMDKTRNKRRVRDDQPTLF